MRCYSCNSTHTCNQWEFNTSNVNVPCRPCNEQAPPHLFFDFLKQLEQPRNLSIPTGKHKSEFPHVTLLSFLLREELGSSLESFSQTHGSTPQKENNTPSHFFFILSQRN